MSSTARNSLKTAVTLAISLVLGSVAGCDAYVSTQQRLGRARHELDSGDIGRAGIELQKVVRAQPDNPDARLLLARLSLMTGDTAAADRDVERAIQAGAKGPDADHLRVETWLAVNRSQALIDAITRNQIQLPEPERSIALARAFNLAGEPQRALEALATPLASPSATTAAHLAHAQALVLLGKSDDALQEIDTAIQRDPGSYQAPFVKGVILGHRGQYTLAEQALLLAWQRMTGPTPLTERALALAALTEARLAQGKIAESSQSQGLLAKLAPAAPITHLLGARIELARGDYLEGIADLERTTAAAPDFIPARMALGAAQLSRGNLLQAESQLAEVVAKAPDNLEARELLARVRLQLDQPGAGLSLLTPAVDTQALSGNPYLSSGSAASGNAELSLEALKQKADSDPSNATVRLDLAQAYLGAGRANEALAHLGPTAQDDARRNALFIEAVKVARGPLAAGEEVDKLLTAHPKSVATLNVAGSYFADQSDFARARVLFRQALALDSHNVQSLTNLARLDAASGDTQAAEASLRAALSVDERNVPVRIGLADILVRRGAVADALHLLQADPRMPPPAELQLAIAQLQLTHGDLQQANASFDSALASQPSRADLANQAGLMLLAGHQYDEALARFRKAVELAPQRAAYWVNMGRAQLALGQSAPARESFAKALVDKPNWVAAVAALTFVDLREKNYAAATDRVDQLLAARPDDPSALALKGDVLSAAGKPSQAVTSYAAAQQRSPNPAVAVKMYLAMRAAAQPSPEEPLKKWLSVQPTDYRVRSVLADFYLSQHSLREAAAEFSTVIRQKADSAVALNNLACIYLELGDPRAEAFAQRAYDLAPGSASVTDTLGWILVRKQATARGLPLLEKAAHAAAQDPELQYHYAYALAQAGKRSEAKEILSRALASDRYFAARRDAERLLADLTV